MIPSTGELPFLAVYGAWLWPVVAAIATALLLATTWIRSRRVARAAIRGVRDRHLSEPLAEGEAIIRGTLGAREGGVLAATVLVESNDEERAGPRDWHRELWLDTAEGRVALAGAVRVLAGARRHAHLGIPRATPAPLRAAHPELTPYSWSSWIRVSTLDTLKAGDEVIARGTLERGPGAAEAGYRSSETISTLLSLHDHITLASARPRSSTLRRSLLAYLLIVSGAMLTSYLAVSEVAKSAVDDCVAATGDHDKTSYAFVEFGQTHACAIAASGPKSRAFALERLSWHLERHPFRDERSIRRMVDLAELAGDHARAIRILLEVGHYDQAASLAATTHEPARQLDALTLAGRFRDAAAVAKLDGAASRIGSDVPLLIAAGMWNEAASGVEAYISWRKAPTDGGDPMPAGVELYSHCLSDLLRYHGGDTTAAARLLARYRAPDGVPCAAAALEVASAEDRAAILADPREDRAAASYERLLVGWRHGLWDPRLARDAAGASKLMARLTDAFEEDMYAVFLAPHALASLSGKHASGLERYTGLSWNVAWEMLEGHDAEAHELAALAEAMFPAIESDEADHLDGPALRAVLRLYRRELGDELAFLRDRDTLSREQRSYAPLFLRAGQPARARGVTTELLDAVRAKDGTRFALAISEQSILPEDSTLIGVAPLLETGRDALRASLVYRAPHLLRTANFPFGAALAAVARRELLELIDAHDEAAQWNEIYLRFAEALADPRKTIALMLWD